MDVLYGPTTGAFRTAFNTGPSHARAAASTVAPLGLPLHFAARARREYFGSQPTLDWGPEPPDATGSNVGGDGGGAGGAASAPTGGSITEQGLVPEVTEPEDPIDSESEVSPGSRGLGESRVHNDFRTHLLSVKAKKDAAAAAARLAIMETPDSPDTGSPYMGLRERLELLKLQMAQAAPAQAPTGIAQAPGVPGAARGVPAAPAALPQVRPPFPPAAPVVSPVHDPAVGAPQAQVDVVLTPTSVKPRYERRSRWASRA
jgi:hypothetical protein